jgi:hypothetical protein
LFIVSIIIFPNFKTVQWHITKRKFTHSLTVTKPKHMHSYTSPNKHQAMQSHQAVEDEQERALTLTSCNENGGKRQDKTWQRNGLMTMRRGGEMKRSRNEVAWQCKGIGMLDDKGQRDNTTTNQTNKRTDERKKKQVQHEVMMWQGEWMEAADSLPPKRPIPLP